MAKRRIPNKNIRREPLIKTNDKIRSYEVRLVGRGEPQVIKTSEALDMAYDEGLDLILINESQDPPIARIENLSKFLYKKNQVEKEKKKNTVKTVVKEIQLSPDIAENDLEVKVKRTIKFLEKGFKIKCSLILKGRQKATPERGEIIMLKFATMIEEFGKIENMPKLQSHRWIMMIKKINNNNS
jgi:translation initiation factor IF-3